MTISCIIAEDEPLAMERTKSYVQKLPYLQLQATFDNAMDALLFVKDNPVQLIFLDINMGDFSGIQLLETKSIQSEVIIISAYHEYALKGYELNVTDYLLKPYTFERFIQAVEKVQQKLVNQNIVADKKMVFIKTAYRLEQLLLSDMLYIEGMRDYRKIVTLNKAPIMTLQTFSSLELEMPARLICRVHKSYMVALDKIESVEKDVISIQQQLIPISETYKKIFFELINKSS
jgi:two-component system, LytTR family, response regulator